MGMGIAMMSVFFVLVRGLIPQLVVGHGFDGIGF